MVKLGYNIGTDSISYERAIAAMKASGGDGHLIMISNGDYFLKTGDLETIRKYLTALPTATLIIRLYHKNEGNWSLYPTAAEYENHWRWVKNQLGIEATRRIVFDSPFNEPNLAGDNPLAAKPFVDYNRALVKAAYNAGVKMAVCAFSVGTPHESLLRTVYVDLWRDCFKYKQGISGHYYGIPIPEIGETVGLDTVLDPVKSRAALVDKRWPMDMQGWFIGRAFRIIQIWQDLGLGIPEIYVTEGIIDNVFNSSSSGIKDQWREKFGLPQYEKDPRGAACWEKWLLEVFKHDRDASGNPLDFQAILSLLFRHARKNVFYHVAFKAVCIFALNAQWGLGYGNHPKGTNYGAGSNFDHPLFDRFRNEYLPKLNAESFGETPMPEIVMEVKRIRSLNESNIRAAASTTSTVLHVIRTDWLEGKISRDSLTPDAPQKWHKIEVTVDGKLISGYIAKTALLVVEDIPIVIPPPAPTLVKKYWLEFDGATRVVSEETWKELISYYELRAAALKTIEPVLVAETKTEEKTDAAA